MNLQDLIPFLMVAATVGIAIFTYYLIRASKLQFVALMSSAFQNEWHNTRAVLMRDYIHSKEFEEVFNEAILKAYGTNISYREIGKLLEKSELKGKTTNSKRLKKFEVHLKSNYPDTFDYKQFPFSAYQALYEVLLSFDRLAIFRDDSDMMDSFIRRYRPPIRDLSIAMQAFIAIRIMLRESYLKNYKKGYIHLLALLSIDPLDLNFPLNLKLFEICKQGLISRKELSGKELENWDKIIQQRRV